MMVTIPWKSWYGDEQLELTFPSGWEVRFFPMQDGIAIEDENIKRALKSPIASHPLSVIAKGKKKAVILVDDISRPTPAHKMLPFVINELKDAGIRERDLRIIMSLGAHRPMMREDLIKKLGEHTYNCFEIHNHHPYENLEHLGTSTRGTPIYINKLFMDADVKIGIGCIVPHAYAGFGGGGKIVLPGIAGIETLEANHQPATKGLKAGLGILDGNEVREDIDEIAQKAGLHFIVNAVINSRRGLAGLFCGDVIKAHREGVKLAQRMYRTEVPSDLDVGILNAYPKDTELFQASLALDLYLSAKNSIIKKEGVIVITSASPEGGGFHSLEGYQMRLYGYHDQFPSVRKAIGDRTLCIFSPNATSHEVGKYYSPSVLHFKVWEELIAYLQKRFSGRCKIGIFPCASVQLASEVAPL
jgi:nickel-dependent lactate racemase